MHIQQLRPERRLFKRHIVLPLLPHCSHNAATIDEGISSHRPMDSLELVTWNLASPNNNPFEFWVHISD